MKKTIIVFALLFALVCALLCGCTPPETDRPEQEVNLPEPQTAQQDPEPADTASQNVPAGTAQPAAPDTEEPASGNAAEFDDEPELETVSDYVVDGGDGFGIGGN